MNRQIGLDLLRALAILLVLIRHMPPCPKDLSRPLWAISSLLTRGGWIGVDIFFVLSGFLVAGLLFRELKTGKVDLRRFLIRRAFKIYPAFLCLISITAFMELYWTPQANSVVGKLASEVLFVQNYFPSYWMHTWSLAVEEHTYLAIALFFYLFASKQSFAPIFISFTLATACLCALARIYAITNHTIYDPYKASHCRMDSILFGSLLAYLYIHHKATLCQWTPRPRYCFIIGTILVMPAFLLQIENSSLLQGPWLTVLYFAAGIVLLGTLAIERFSVPGLKSIALVGRYSYSIYLFHLCVLDWMILPWFGDGFASGSISNWIIQSAAYLTLAITIGVVASILIEAYFLRVRDRLYPSRSPALL